MWKRCARAAIGAVIWAGCAGASYADSVTRPGEGLGVALGYPVPEGVFLSNNFNVGRAGRDNAPTTMSNIPVLLWSSPFKIFGARIQPAISIPTVFVNPSNPAPIPNNNASFQYNPFVGSGFAWDLGNGFGAAYLIGAHLALSDRGSLGLGFAGTPLAPGAASTTIRNGFAVSYVGDGSYNLTFSLSHALTVDPQARFGGAVGRVLGPQAQADGLNLDVTLARWFGKVQLGAVAFGYTDLAVDRTDPIYQRYQYKGQFAAGGLVGYNFGRFIVQSYVTHDIVARETMNRFGQRLKNEETRGFLRVILPLYVADPALVAAALKEF